jgi:outer membrane receptor protein involved in Fe transport
MIRRRSPGTVALILFLASGLARAQGIPSGSIAGSVTAEADGQPLPGVSLTARSPALQGARRTVSAVNGDFSFPNLPPGEYSLELQLSGFQPVTRSGILVGTSQRQVLYIAMSVEAVSEKVVVTAKSEQVSMTPQSSTTLTSTVLTQLPVARTLESAALLAPDVNSRPANSYVSAATDAFSIAGGETYENTINIDGVSPQENYFRLPEPLYIEDAIAEVATLTSGISAEYGRFSGGVVNVLTKTGGNAFSGSFRTTLVNDAWSARTPYGEERSQNLAPIYEATLGVPIWKDRIWFFGAGRLFDQTSTLTTAPPTGISFPKDGTDKRYQLKLTASPLQSQTITFGYTHASRSDSDTYFPGIPILDLASTYDQSFKENHLLVNYSGTLSTNVFLEANYGQLRLTHVAGSTDTSLLTGTPLFRPAPFAQYNAPIFCAACPSPEDDRSTDQGVLKATLFAPTPSLGSHTVVAGLEAYKGSTHFNNWQSGSGYWVTGTDVILDHGDLYPVLGPGTVLAYYSIPVLAAPTDIRTYSAYVNDTWYLNDRLTFNLGLRWDKNDARDAGGVSLSTDGNLSPRLAVTWDPTGKGAWRITGSYGQYVSSINENQIAWTTPYGTPALFQYFYDGPQINMDPSQPLVSRADALGQLFQWFGITAPGQFPRGIDPFSVSVPGVSLQMRGDLKSQRADEVTLGVNGSIGTMASFRVEGAYRKYGNFYAVDLDRTTGTVSDPYGNEYDLGILRNANEPLERHHMGLKTSLQLQPGRSLAIGGSWTWAHTYGNQISENLVAGPNPPYDLTYPEYWQPAWHIPVGDLPQDVRHRVRLWATWDLTFIPASLGHFNLAPLFALDTGLPYGASAPVFVGDYVANPGYVLPPSYLTYWFSARDAFRTPTVTRLDLALNYAIKLGPAELFIQPQVLNVINSHSIALNDPSLIDQGVRTAVNSPDLQPFDPSRTHPVQGINYALSQTFGQALSPAAYQQPRTFRISMGVRF